MSRAESGTLSVRKDAGKGWNGGQGGKRAREISAADGESMWKVKGGRQGGEGEGSEHSSGGELAGKQGPQLGEQALV